MFSFRYKVLLLSLGCKYPFYKITASKNKNFILTSTTKIFKYGTGVLGNNQLQSKYIGLYRRIRLYIKGVTFNTSTHFSTYETIIYCTHTFFLFKSTYDNIFVTVSKYLTTVKLSTNYNNHVQGTDMTLQAIHCYT